MFKQSRQKGREHRSKKGEINREELRKALQESRSEASEHKSNSFNRYWRH